MGRPPRPVLDRFLDRVVLSEKCWTWAGSIDKYGYGVIKINGKHVKAHRLSHTLFVGSIPHGHLVRHTCDNPACIRPSHLLSGTDADNKSDMCSRSRQARGSRHGNSKLTELDVRDILASAATGRCMAKAYSVMPSLISKIRKRQVWKHVV